MAEICHRFAYPCSMAQPDRQLTRDELLAAAARAGFNVSENQLKRWVREGLVPRPRQLHKRGKAGSRTLYPPGTLRQLFAVCRLAREERRFDELRFDVWWEGWWVDSPLQRDSLAKLLDEKVADIRGIRADHEDPFEAAEAVLDEAQAGSGRSPVTRLLQRRVGRDPDYLRSALYPFLLLAFGAEPSWEPVDLDFEGDYPAPLELVVRIMGLDRAASDPVNGGESLPRESPDVRPDLKRLRDAGAFELERPGEAVLKASDEELELARVAARAIAQNLTDLAEAAEYGHGRDVAGLGIFSAMRRADARWFGAYLVRYLLVAATVIPKDQLNEVLESLHKTRPQIAAALEIANAFPGYKRFLMPGSERSLEDLPVAEREAIQTALNTYVAERPHLRRALGISD